MHFTSIAAATPRSCVGIDEVCDVAKALGKDRLEVIVTMPAAHIKGKEAAK